MCVRCMHLCTCAPNIQGIPLYTVKLVRLILAPVWRLYTRRALDATVREIELQNAASPARAL